VADAPVDALLARADELARRWASALIAARPLAEMVAVPLADLAREGPELCAQLARALVSDAELEQLLAPVTATERGRAPQSGPSALAAWLALARDASSVVRDVEVLRSVVSEVALGELREPTAGRVADLSDRLAFVCAALLAALLDRHEPAGAPAPPAASPAPGRERVLYSSPGALPGGRRAVLIDERDETTPSPVRSGEAPVDRAVVAPSYAAARSPRETAPERSEPGRRVVDAPRARPWDTPLDAARPTAGGEPDPTSPRVVPDGGGAELRVTRAAGAPVDERA
jgi:hypothetical protein